MKSRNPSPSVTWQVGLAKSMLKSPEQMQETLRKTSRSKFCGLANKPHVGTKSLWLWHGMAGGPGCMLVSGIEVSVWEKDKTETPMYYDY